MSHRDRPENWNPASILYKQTAESMGIPVHVTASNRHRCIFCGHRMNAGMPCKYDALMSTAITQIPKALDAEPSSSITPRCCASKSRIARPRCDLRAKRRNDHGQSAQARGGFGGRDRHTRRYCGARTSTSSTTMSGDT